MRNEEERSSKEDTAGQEGGEGGEREGKAPKRNTGDPPGLTWLRDRSNLIDRQVSR